MLYFILYLKILIVLLLRCKHNKVSNHLIKLSIRCCAKTSEPRHFPANVTHELVGNPCSRWLLVLQLLLLLLMILKLILVWSLRCWYLNCFATLSFILLERPFSLAVISFFFSIIISIQYLVTWQKRPGYFCHVLQAKHFIHISSSV